MKYQVLFDYGCEGWNFENKEFETVDEAVKHAVGTQYPHPFRIVQVIDWQAVNSTPREGQE